MLFLPMHVVGFLMQQLLWLQTSGLNIREMLLISLEDCHNSLFVDEKDFPKI